MIHNVEGRTQPEKQEIWRQSSSWLVRIPPHWDCTCDQGSWSWQPLPVILMWYVWMFFSMGGNVWEIFLQNILWKLFSERCSFQLITLTVQGFFKNHSVTFRLFTTTQVQSNPRDLWPKEFKMIRVFSELKEQNYKN